MPNKERFYRFKRFPTSRVVFLKEKFSKEVKSNFWSLDNVLKLVSTFLAVGGFISGILIFQVQQRSTERQGFQMKLWERKLAIYNALADVTGELIIKRNNSNSFDSLSEQFDKIYYSSLVLVQDSMVEKKVVRFRDAIVDYKDSIKSSFYLKEKQVELMRQIGISLKSRQEFAND